MELRSNQITPTKLGIDFFQKKDAVPSIIVAPTAFGKSWLIAKIAESVSDKILILQPSKELLEQNFGKYIAIGGTDAAIYSASFNSRRISSVTYATIGSIKKIGGVFRELGFTKMIIDECFVAGTLIDKRAIENIRVGDYVNSFNHKTKKTEFKKVLATSKKLIDGQLLKFKFSNGGEFVCTKNHPIYINKLGYIPAFVVSLCVNNYTHAEGVRLLQKNIQNEQRETISLFGNLLETLSKSKHSKNRNKLPTLRQIIYHDRGQAESLSKDRRSLLLKGLFLSVLIRRYSGCQTFGTNESEQPFAQPNNIGKNDRIEQGQNILSQRGKRTAYKATTPSPRNDRIPNGVSDNFRRGKGQISFASQVLQSGLGRLDQKISNRGGRQKPQFKEMEVLGLSENGNTELLRVESCEIYKRGSGQKFDALCPENYVYNLEVEDNHNYFANKILVHNCHLFPREADSMLHTFLKESGITHVLGLTATPLKLQTNRSMTGDSFSKLVMLTSRSKKGNFFKEIIYVSQVQEMVDLGFWCKLEYEQYDIDEGMLVYNSTKAEFTEESIKATYDHNNTERNIVNKIADLSDRKSILVFVPSVADAKHLSGITPNAVAVYGDMPKHERDIAIKNFKSQQLRVIYNVNVLSVGFDHPQLDAIICARSTASLAWYYQALGRLTRIHPDKQDGLIVDFSGNVKRFGKVEQFYYKKENIWKLYGEGGKLLTGMPLHEIGSRTEETEKKRENPVQDGKVYVGFGKHKELEVKDAPESWRKWIYEEFTKNNSWNKYNDHVRKEIERLNNKLVETQ